jgi:hypothetical protein
MSTKHKGCIPTMEKPMRNPGHTRHHYSETQTYTVVPQTMHVASIDVCVSPQGWRAASGSAPNAVGWPQHLRAQNLTTGSGDRTHERNAGEPTQGVGQGPSGPASGPGSTLWRDCHRSKTLAFSVGRPGSA